jgi:hypothetical protein
LSVAAFFAGLTEVPLIESIPSEEFTMSRFVIRLRIWRSPSKTAVLSSGPWNLRALVTALALPPYLCRHFGVVDSQNPF